MGAEITDLEPAQANNQLTEHVHTLPATQALLHGRQLSSTVLNWLDGCLGGYIL